MVQWLNIAGIRAAWSAAVDRSLITPHLAVQDIRKCSFQRLSREGYRYVVFDKDNCLALPYANALHPDLKVRKGFHLHLLWYYCLACDLPFNVFRLLLPSFAPALASAVPPALLLDLPLPHGSLLFLTFCLLVPLPLLPHLLPPIPSPSLSQPTGHLHLLLLRGAPSRSHRLFSTSDSLG
eukprot:m.78416 g.78416  ORF g.78416 m.78416 type:complete len:180 (-) comp14108_c0_seq2:595-1134(-)